MQIRMFALIVVLVSVVLATRGELPEENAALLEMPLAQEKQLKNPLSDSPEERVAFIPVPGVLPHFAQAMYKWRPILRDSEDGEWKEHKPENPPLVNVQAAHIAEMAVPLVQLAYTWRKDEDKINKKDAQEQVNAAKKFIEDFPDKPGVRLDDDKAHQDHRVYATSANIPHYDSKGKVAGKRNAVIIGFPGTESAHDINQDARAAWKLPFKMYNGKQWRAAQGFFEQYKSHLEADDFENKLKEYVKEQKPEYIYVVGHSMGGAVAAICAADLATRKEYKDYKIVVITFGQPRAFNYETATDVNNLFKQGNKNGNEYWRILQYGDVVPDLPPTEFGFEHVGRPFDLNKKTWWNPSLWRGGDPWEFQEKRQDYSPQIMGVTLTAHCCSDPTSDSCLSTHPIGEYKCRLAELHKQIDKKTDSSVKIAAAVNNILARLDHQILAFGGVFVLVAFLFYLRARKQAQEDSVYIALMNTTEQEI